MTDKSPENLHRESDEQAPIKGAVPEGESAPTPTPRTKR